MPYEIARLEDSTYRDIRKGAEVSLDELNRYFRSPETKEYQELLWEIVGKLWLNEGSLCDYQMTVWALSPERAERIVKKTLPKMRVLLGEQLDKAEPQKP